VIWLSAIPDNSRRTYNFGSFCSFFAFCFLCFGFLSDLGKYTLHVYYFNPSLVDLNIVTIQLNTLQHISTEKAEVEAGVEVETGNRQQSES
jgi:hypothetical protein